MHESLRRFQEVFYPLASELIADGPAPFIDTAEELLGLPRPTPHVFYIGRASEFDPSATGVTCALILDAPLSDEAVAGNNLFLFPADTNPSLLFSKLREYFASRTIFARKTDAIYETHLRGEGLQAVLDVASEGLGYSLLLCGPDLELIARSESLGADLDIRTDLSDIFSAIPQDLKLLGGQAGQGREPGPADACCLQSPEYLVFGIRSGGGLAAYLLVRHGGGVLRRWDRELISIIVQIIAAELPALQEQTSAKGSSFEKFILHLIDGAIGDEEAIESGAKLFNMETRGCFSLLLVHINQYHRLLQSIQSVRGTLVRLTGDGYSAIYRDSIVLLLRYRSEKAYEDFDMGPVERYLQEKKLYGTRSRLFYRLGELHGHYVKSRQILDLYFCAPEGKYLNSAEDMGLFPLVSALLNTHTREELIEPAVKAIQEVDERRKTSYIDTLYMYLKCAKNPADTRRRLYIHRNTLDYRIQKLSEIARIDWNDGDALFRLYLSVSVIKYLELRRRQKL